MHRRASLSGLETVEVPFVAIQPDNTSPKPGRWLKEQVWIDICFPVRISLGAWNTSHPPDFA
jgi:hypothetical protein